MVLQQELSEKTTQLSEKKIFLVIISVNQLSDHHKFVNFAI